MICVRFLGFVLFTLLAAMLPGMPVAAAAHTSAQEAPSDGVAPIEWVADYPIRVVMPRLGVDHWLEERGATGGQLDEPHDGVNGVAWYSAYGTPGASVNSLFSAHETWNRQHGPFYWLHLAEPGDEVWVEMASGGWHLYSVFSNQRHDAESMPMSEIVWPSAQPTAEEWVTFFTCGGAFARLPNGYYDYLERDVVIAKRLR